MRASRAILILKKEGPLRYLEGEEALTAVRTILATPGVCAIDFETYPTDPAWHADDAARHAVRGTKSQERKQALLNAQKGGRAKQRRACTLQLAHEHVAEPIFVRLRDGSDDQRAVELQAMFADRTAELVAHSAQFETEILFKHGVEADIDCTMLAAKALYLQAMRDDQPQPVSFRLADRIVDEFPGQTRDKTIRDRDWRSPESLDDEAIRYGLLDAVDCLELWLLYRERLKVEKLFDGYRTMVRALLPTAATNLKGLTLDTVAHTHLMARMTEDAARLKGELDQCCVGMPITNHGSTQQVATWIMDQVLTPKPDAGPEQWDEFYRLHDAGLEARHQAFEAALKRETVDAVSMWKTTKTGHLAITKGGKIRKAEQLAKVVEFKVVSEYLIKHAQWNKATKLIDSFGPTLIEWQDSDGRCRGQFRTWAAWTGRQSCSNPNLQNQPHDPVFRALWIAPPGRKLVIADYSQIELRLLAIVAEDERLREVYREDRDVHDETAKIAGVDRKAAKSVNFAMAYGSGAGGMAENFGFSLEHAQEVMDRVLGVYTGLARFRETAPGTARANGWIQIRPGRRVKYDRNSPATTAINAPIQGGAASVQMLALRMLYDELKARPDLGAFMCASVHDEFLVEAPDEHAEEVGRIMVEQMGAALVEIYPEAEEMGMHRLTAATVAATLGGQKVMRNRPDWDTWYTHRELCDFSAHEDTELEVGVTPEDFEKSVKWARLWPPVLALQGEDGLAPFEQAPSPELRNPYSVTFMITCTAVRSIALPSGSCKIAPCSASVLRSISSAAFRSSTAVPHLEGEDAVCRAAEAPPAGEDGFGLTIGLAAAVGRLVGFHGALTRLRSDTILGRHELALAQAQRPTGLGCTGYELVPGTGSVRPRFAPTA